MSFFSSSKIKDLEASARTLLEVTSWVDWWFYNTKSLPMSDCSRRAKVEDFFVTGDRMQLLLVETTSTIWANSVLKYRDALMGKVKDDVSLESFMEVHNALLSCLTELFLPGVLERAAEKSSWVLHDEAIMEAVTMEKKQQKPSKKLQF